MILVRNVFRLRFGTAREAVATMRETIEATRRAAGHEVPIRLLTDLTGDFYTVVVERSYQNMIDFEETAKRLMAEPQWQAAYRKLTPLVESGYRDIFTVVDLSAASTP